MRRRRPALFGGAIALLLGSSLVVDPAVADPAASIDDSGWWWRAQTSPDVMLPGPPTVDEGELLVQSGPEGAIALAAISGTLVEGQANPILTLDVAEGGDVGGDGAVVLACQAGSTWQGGDAQAWPEHPQAGCEAGGVEGQPSDDGTQWTFDLGALQFADQVNVVIVPGVVEGQPEGANHPTFSLTFAPPTVASLSTTPGEAPTTTPPSDPVVTPARRRRRRRLRQPARRQRRPRPPARRCRPARRGAVAHPGGAERAGAAAAAAGVAERSAEQARACRGHHAPPARRGGGVRHNQADGTHRSRGRHRWPGRWAAPRWGTPPSLRG